MGLGANPSGASLAFGTGTQSLLEHGFANCGEGQGIQPTQPLPLISVGLQSTL